MVCYATPAERDAYQTKRRDEFAAALARAEQVRREEFLREREEAERAQTERQEIARLGHDERAQAMAVKAEAERERVARAELRAEDKAYAVPAISAQICDLAQGVNRDWVDVWKELLRERHHAKPMPCADVADVLACAGSPPDCGGGAAQDVADVWRLAHRTLWGGGPRSEAPLRCCDGSDSPSCVCGGPRQGCCSHHGGVCGCSR